MPTQAGETTCPLSVGKGGAVLSGSLLRAGFGGRLDLCLAGVGVSCSLPSHRSQLGARLALVPRKLANKD